MICSLLLAPLSSSSSTPRAAGTSGVNCLMDLDSAATMVQPLPSLLQSPYEYPCRPMRSCLVIEAIAVIRKPYYMLHHRVLGAAYLA